MVTVGPGLCNWMRSLQTYMYIARVITAMLNINVVGWMLSHFSTKNKKYIESRLKEAKSQAVYCIISQCYEISYWLLVSSNYVTARWWFIQNRDSTKDTNEQVKRK